MALAGEGGHASFAPVTKQEMKILQALWEEYGHVSAERLLSGLGLELIHRALAGQRLSAPEITSRALDGSSMPAARRSRPSARCWAAWPATSR
jgi:glucokinase